LLRCRPPPDAIRRAAAPSSRREAATATTSPSATSCRVRQPPRSERNRPLAPDAAPAESAISPSTAVDTSPDNYSEPLPPHPESPPPPPAAAAPHECATPTKHKRSSPRSETSAGGTADGSGVWIDRVFSFTGALWRGDSRAECGFPLILHPAASLFAQPTCHSP